MTDPISPQQAKEQYESTVPPHVIEAVNTLLRKGGGHPVTFTYAELKIALGMETIPTEWVKFDVVFGPKGWRVICDVPAYYEKGSTRWYFHPK